MSADRGNSHEIALGQLGDDAPLQKERQVVLLPAFMNRGPLTRANKLLDAPVPPVQANP